MIKKILRFKKYSVTLTCFTWSLGACFSCRIVMCMGMCRFVAIVDFLVRNPKVFGTVRSSSPGVHVVVSVICRYRSKEYQFWGFGDCTFVGEGLDTCSRRKKFLFV